jgi:hypothetical protein
VATRLRDGAIAGIVGGIVSAVWGLVMSPILGTDVLHETRLAAVPLLGQAALRPEHALLAFAVGGASHLAVSVAWAILFALLCYPLSPPAMIGAGALFGVVVWRLMFDGVLPMLGVAWVVGGISPARAVTEHVAYGVGVALGLLWLKKRGRATHEA